MCVCLLVSGFVHACMGMSYCLVRVCVQCQQKAKPIDLQGLNSFSQRAHLCSLLCALWASCAVLVVVVLLNSNVQTLDAQTESWLGTMLQNRVCDHVSLQQHEASHKDWNGRTQAWSKSLKKSSGGSVRETVNSFFSDFSDILIINLLDLRQLDLISSLTL